MALSKSTILVTLNISQWTGRRLDRTATATVEREHSTRHGSGNFTKKLLPGCTELDAIRRQATVIRTFYYNETLPWLADGSRILAAQNHLSYCERIQPLIAEFNRLVQSFLTVYPSEVAKASLALGNLHNSSEYPHPGRMAALFGIHQDFLPTPDVSDFRIESISDAERTRFESRMATVTQNALSDCYARLRDVISSATDKLSQPDAIFRDSLISNIQSMCDLLPRLDFTNDPQLADFRARTESAISRISPEILRDDKIARESTARTLADINDAMSAFMGPEGA